MTGPRQNGRPEIDVATPLAERADKVWAALMDANHPQFPAVMVRGNTLVQMTEAGTLTDYSAVSLRDKLSWAVDYRKRIKGGATVAAANPPPADAETLIQRDSAEYVGAPRVDRVIDVPVVGRDGKLVTRPGHHPDSRLYFRPAKGLEDLEVPAAGSVQSADQVIEAREFVETELFSDYRFGDAGSRAHAWSLMLLPFVRELIDGPTPMHGIFAPMPGTGKGYLAETCLIPACGPVGTQAGSGKNDEEWRKVITSHLMSGASAIVFDNLHGTLESAALASAMTTGIWQDRVLGGNKLVKLPITNAWVATANNPRMSHEHARRIAPIFLEPGDVVPSDRPAGSFRHPDLHSWALENRSDLVQALLLLVQHWLSGAAVLDPSDRSTLIRQSDLDSETPSPEKSRATLGSFQNWAATMGGILEAADIDGFLTNRERLREEVDEEHREMAQFLSAWHALDAEPMLAKDLAALCEYGGALHDDLPIALFDRKALERIAYWLRDRNQQKFGGFRLVRREGRGNNRYWYVQKVA